MQRTAALAALAREYDEIFALVDDLAPEEWDAPSVRGDRSCRDVFAHIAATDEAVVRGSLVLGSLPGRDPERTREKSHARWRTRPLPELRGKAEVHAGRLVKLLWVASRVGWQLRLPTGYGRLGIGDLVVLRIHDLWIHNRDIAIAVGRPAPDPRRTAASLTWLSSAIPRRLGPPLRSFTGRRVCLRVGGGVSAAFAWEVGARGIELLSDQDAWSGPLVSDVRVTLDTEILVVCGTGREDPSTARRDGRIEVEGDTAFGEAFVDALPSLA